MISLSMVVYGNFPHNNHYVHKLTPPLTTPYVLIVSDVSNMAPLNRFLLFRYCNDQAYPQASQYPDTCYKMFLQTNALNYGETPYLCLHRPLCTAPSYPSKYRYGLPPFHSMSEKRNHFLFPVYEYTSII